MSSSSSSTSYLSSSSSAIPLLPPANFMDMAELLQLIQDVRPFLEQMRAARMMENRAATPPPPPPYEHKEDQDHRGKDEVQYYDSDEDAQWVDDGGSGEIPFDDAQVDEDTRRAIELSLLDGKEGDQEDDRELDSEDEVQIIAIKPAQKRRRILASSSSNKKRKADDEDE